MRASWINWVALNPKRSALIRRGETQTTNVEEGRVKIEADRSDVSTANQRLEEARKESSLESSDEAWFY